MLVGKVHEGTACAKAGGLRCELVCKVVSAVRMWGTQWQPCTCAAWLNASFLAC